MGRSQVARLLFLSLLLILLPIVNGCGSVSVSGAITPSPTPSPTVTASPTPSPSPTPVQASRFIYGTPGFESGSVEGGAIMADGSVKPIPGSPFNEGLGTPSIIQITADVQGRFVYVLNVEASAFGIPIGNPGIAGFKVNRQTGALTPVPGSPIVFPVRNDNLLAVDPSGHFLVEPNGQGDLSSSGFDVYAIDQNTGALTKTASNSNAPPVGTFSVSSLNRQFMFNAGNGMVEAFSVAVGTGQLTAVPGTPLATGGSAGPLAVSSDGLFLYVANQNEGTVAVFAIGTNGALTLVRGTPFAVDTGVQAIRLTPDGRFLFVAAFTQTSTGANETVKGYAVNPAAGTFVAVSGAIVNNVDAIAIGLSGKLAFISAVGTLFTYSIDPATGNLTQLSRTSAPSTDNPNDIVTIP